MAIFRLVLFGAFVVYCAIGLYLLVVPLAAAIWITAGLFATVVLYYSGIRFDKWARGEMRNRGW